MNDTRIRVKDSKMHKADLDIVSFIFFWNHDVLPVPKVINISFRSREIFSERLVIFFFNSTLLE